MAPPRHCIAEWCSNRVGKGVGILHCEERGEVKMNQLSPAMHFPGWCICFCSTSWRWEVLDEWCIYCIQNKWRNASPIMHLVIGVSLLGDGDWSITPNKPLDLFLEPCRSPISKHAVPTPTLKRQPTTPHVWKLQKFYIEPPYKRNKKRVTTIGHRVRLNSKPVG